MIAHTPRGYVGAAIFGAALIACFSVSASYHLVQWPDVLQRVMKRIDHSMIFVLIAGTYTPFCLVVLHGAWSISMLAVVWSIAGAGVVLKIAWPSAPRPLSVGAYLAAGWVALVATVPLLSAMALPALALLALGGVLCSIGGVVYGLRRPDPFPRVFGYHEVFHALVIAGVAVYFSLVAFYVLPR
jgi:hemolysin III